MKDHVQVKTRFDGTFGPKIEEHFGCH